MANHDLYVKKNMEMVGFKYKEFDLIVLLRFITYW